MANCRKSASSYKNGCRCLDCKRAHAAYAREYARRTRSPGWVPTRRVDPAEAAAHLVWLHSHGIGVVAVHRASGVDMNTLIAVRLGTKKHLLADTANRILAVGLHRVPSIEMVRERIDELVARGWTHDDIALAAGISDYTVYEIANKKRNKVWPRTAERVLSVGATSARPSR